MEKVSCKGPNCKVKVVWAINPDTGKKVPVDVSCAVYTLEEEDGEVIAKRVKGWAGVNHYSTCVDAAKFTKKKEGGK